MADSFIQLGPDSTGKKQTTYDRGATGHQTYAIAKAGRKQSGCVMASTYRIPANGVVINIAYAYNLPSSPVLMGIREFIVDVDATAVRTAQARCGLYRINTLVPTGGTDATKHLLDSGGASHASCVFRGGASADGTASAITWSIPVGMSAMWNAFLMRMHTTTTTGGQVLQMPDHWLLPPACKRTPVILRPGEALIARCADVEIAGNHVKAMCSWDEFTIPVA